MYHYHDKMNTGSRAPDHDLNMLNDDNVKAQLEIWTDFKLKFTNLKFQVELAQLQTVTLVKPNCKCTDQSKVLSWFWPNLKSFYFTNLGF